MSYQENRFQKVRLTLHDKITPRLDFSKWCRGSWNVVSVEESNVTIGDKGNAANLLSIVQSFASVISSLFRCKSCFITLVSKKY